MIDVARLAGVSQSTVSYVLSGSRPISNEVRQKVELAARQLNYAPRAAARALRGGSTGTLALSIPSGDASADAWLGLYLLRLTLAAQKRGFDLLVSAEAGDPAGRLRQIAGGRRADGVILMSVKESDDRLTVAQETGFPTVALGEPGEPGIPFVDFDFRAGAALAVNHLAAAGHRGVLYVGAKQSEVDEGYLYVRRAVGGIRDAAQEKGLEAIEFHPQGDRVLDASRFREILDHQPQLQALILTSTFSNFELFRSTFLRCRPKADPERDVLAFGASGLAGDDQLPSRVVNPVDTLAAASVDAVLEIISGRAAVSRLVGAQLVTPSRN
jgi:DNA-binding LacI/PurR family transcriptional regulator